MFAYSRMIALFYALSTEKIKNMDKSEIERKKLKKDLNSIVPATRVRRMLIEMSEVFNVSSICRIICLSGSQYSLIKNRKRSHVRKSTAIVVDEMYKYYKLMIKKTTRKSKMVDRYRPKRFRMYETDK